MNNQMKLYRQRFIPEETVYLKDDKILYVSDQLVITSWNCIKPRKDIASGISAYYLDKGYKITKVFDHNHKLVYWYCDIITHTYDASSNSLTVIDLLVDILVYEDNSYKILDLDELADCIEQNTISSEFACTAIRCVNNLLSDIYDGTFVSYQRTVERYDT